MKSAVTISLIFATGLLGFFLFRQKKGTATIENLSDTSDPNYQDASGSVYDEAIAYVTDIFDKGAKYRAIFDAAERDNGIPSGLLYRQAQQESSFRDDIITGAVSSPAGALGIMQIVLASHPDCSRACALNPACAVPYAAKYMRQLHAQFGTWDLALAAYNAGPGNVRKYGGIPPFAETERYVNEILADVMNV